MWTTSRQGVRDDSSEREAGRVQKERGRGDRVMKRWEKSEEERKQRDGQQQIEQLKRVVKFNSCKCVLRACNLKQKAAKWNSTYFSISTSVCVHVRPPIRVCVMSQSYLLEPQ